MRRDGNFSEKERLQLWANLLLILWSKISDDLEYMPIIVTIFIKCIEIWDIVWVQPVAYFGIVDV